MRDAAGKRANTFEALRPQELGLELFLFGNVRVDSEHGPRCAIIISDERGARIDNHLAPIFAAVFDFAVEFSG